MLKKILISSILLSSITSLSAAVSFDYVTSDKTNFQITTEYRKYQKDLIEKINRSKICILKAKTEEILSQCDKSYKFNLKDKYYLMPKYEKKENIFKTKKELIEKINKNVLCIKRTRLEKDLKSCDLRK